MMELGRDQYFFETFILLWFVGGLSAAGLNSKSCFNWNTLLKTVVVEYMYIGGGATSLTFLRENDTVANQNMYSSN